MGIIAALIGLPVTFICIAIGIVFVLLGAFISKKIDSQILKNIILLLFCLPICVVSSLYLGGVLTSILYWYSQGFEGISEVLITPIISMLVGTLNLLEPGHISMGDNGPKIDTVNETVIVLFFSIIANLFFVYRYNNRN